MESIIEVFFGRGKVREEVEKFAVVTEFCVGIMGS